MPIDSIGKVLLWSHIRFVCSFVTFPLYLVGYCKAISSLDELGGIGCLGPSPWLIDNMSYLDLVDVLPRNVIFTWNNRRCGNDYISERLDMFLVSYYWVGINWTTYFEILGWKGSDHWPFKFSSLLLPIPKNLILSSNLCGFGILICTS